MTGAGSALGGEETSGTGAATGATTGAVTGAAAAGAGDVNESEQRDGRVRSRKGLNYPQIKLTSFISDSYISKGRMLCSRTVLND